MPESAPPTYDDLLVLVASLQAELTAAREEIVADAERLEHAVEVCPDCGHALTGGWEYSSRESLVFPQETVRVVRHVCVARRCGVCGRTVIGRPDPVQCTNHSDKTELLPYGKPLSFPGKAYYDESN